MTYPLLAIDVGTVNTRMAAYLPSRNEVEIVALGGRKLYPSIVFLKDHKPLFGPQAEALADADPTHRLVALKRRLGSSLRAPFDGFAPTTLLEHYFDHLVNAFRSTPIGRAKFDRAVFTVPVEFSTDLRDMYRALGHKLGFRGVAVIPEPIAAALPALAKLPADSTLLVLDWGGGTLDVAVLQITADRIIELGHSGSALTDSLDAGGIGGTVADEILADLVMERLTGEGVPIEKLRGDLEGIRRDARLAKEQLSTRDRYESVYETPGVDPVPYAISRPTLEERLTPFLAHAHRVLQVALQQSGLRDHEVSRVLLVGGMFQIPLLRAWVLSRFPRDVVAWADSSGTAVVEGAAAYPRFLEDFVEFAHEIGVLVAENDGRVGDFTRLQQLLPRASVQIDAFAEAGDAFKACGPSIKREYYVGSRETESANLFLVENRSTGDGHSRSVPLGHLSVPCAVPPPEILRRAGGAHIHERLVVETQVLGTGALQVSARSEVRSVSKQLQLTNACTAFRRVTSASTK
jgi:molecular chaperone DnaK (HSP70)